MWQLTVQLNRAYDSLPASKRFRLFLAIIITLLAVPALITFGVTAMTAANIDTVALYVYGPPIVVLLTLLLTRSAYVFRW